MLRNKEVHPNEFIYMIKNRNSESYDLKVVSFFMINKLKCQQYYTLSSKGVTFYEKGLPKEFIFLGDWLRERDQYFALKSLSFFKKFRKWKTLKKWQKLLQIRKNKQVARVLQENLFQVHSIYQKILLKHRSYTMNIESIRLMDLSSFMEVKSLEEFSEIQSKKRRLVFDYLQILSEQMHESCKIGLQVLMERIQTHIRSELSDEDEQFGLMARAKVSKENKEKKPFNKKGLIELLNLPDKLSYQHRSILRAECLKVLRFAYLLDFVTLESLANVYMSSLKDFLKKIEKMKVYELQRNNIQSPKKRFEVIDPLLLIKATFVPNFFKRSELRVSEVEVDGYDITTHIQDFDLELFSEFTDSPFAFDNQEEKPAVIFKKEPSFVLPKRINNPKFQDSFIKTKRQVTNVHKIWLDFVPKKQEFMKFLTLNFTEGLQVLQSVRKWSKSSDFLVYANTLEDWDPVIGENWTSMSEKQYLDPSSWLKLGKYSQCETFLHNILNTFDEEIGRIEDVRESFWEFLDLYWRVKNTNYLEILNNDRLAQPHEIFVFCMNFLEFSTRYCEENLKEGIDLGLFHIDCEGISKEIKGYFNEVNNKIQSIILDVYRSKAQKLRNFLLSNMKTIGNIILKIEDFIDSKENAERIQQSLPIYKLHKEKLEMIYQVLVDNKVPLSKDDKDIYIDIPRYESQLANRLQEFESSANKTTERFSIKLSDTYIRFRSEAEEILNELKDPLFSEFIDEINEILLKLKNLKSKTQKLNLDVNKYQNYATKLQIKGYEEVKELENVKKDIEIKLLLWESLSDWTETILQWKNTPFSELNTEDINERSDKYWKVALQCEKHLLKNMVLDKFKNDVGDFKEIFPIIAALKSPYLKSSHWNELYKLIFVELTSMSPNSRRRLSKNKQEKMAFILESLDPKTPKISVELQGSPFIVDSERSLKNLLFQENFTLNNLLQMNLFVFKDDIIEISFKAQQENSLEKKLAELEQEFEQQTIKMKPLDLQTELLILHESEEFFQTLDEIISSINLLLSSKYSLFLKNRAENLQKNVLFLQELIEKWLETQSKWLYFLRIFSMNEVRRDLVSQASAFESIDKTLKNLIRRLSLNPIVTKILKTVGLNEQFVKFLENFSKIEKDLEIYLDAKRGVFARLCFLSNEELLDLLSKCQDIQQIQPFLLKIFENVSQINVSNDLSIESIKSQENEVLPLKKLTYFKGSLEIWLESLQNSIQDTLRKLLRQGLQEIMVLGLSRIDYISKEIGQIGGLVLFINWTMAIEGVLIEKNQKNLEEIYDISMVHLEKIVTALKACDYALGLKLKNQLMFDLLSRDLLQKLIYENVIDIHDFNWQQSLRIYQDLDSNEILLKQMAFSFPYSFEYQGLKPRLVISPLTTRCFLTISTAFVEGLGVSLWGPAGTGKTETVKELAKFCGVFCLVFNCSEQISYKTLSQLLMGLVVQGVWGCLDEFNRLSLDVLSLVSQTILSIRMSWVLKQNEMEFEGRIINFKRKTYGFCITMNPGYKGRRELPENLKALLRPIYMLIPNFEIISEVILISQGFLKAKELAGKVVSLYKLCETQLSHQNHYDFGLRALKALLIGLENYKSLLDKIREESIVIYALKEYNLGKLVYKDIRIFMQLVHDIFPTIEESPLLKQMSMSYEIEKAFGEMSLQYDDHFSPIILYLKHTLSVRFGIILVGPSTTGKTTVLNMLSHLQDTSLIMINPKSIALDELFGHMSRNSEWKEGIASFLIKEANQRVENSWIVFDGPIDSSWIENLNSVLDDNRTLCLANSERIRLKENMRFFFETDNLNDASPATISRCGIAYFPLYQKLWLLIYNTWLEDLQAFKPDNSSQKSLEKNIVDVIKELGIKILTEGFLLLKEYVGENVELKCIKGICNIFEVILFKEEVDLDGPKEETKRKLNYIWAYAFLWGACSTFDIPNNKVFFFIIYSEKTANISPFLE